MKDGLYQVTTEIFCAGFIVKNERITHCAPILRKRLDYWKTVAVYIPEQCQCGHQYTEHRLMDNGYSEGTCTIGECRCAGYKPVINTD